MPVFDIETNGIRPTLVHCLCTPGLSLTDYGGMSEWVMNQDTLIGHNIVRYDKPALENILGIKIKARIVDTLVLSWYLYPDRRLHGLESWGETFGVPKPKIDDWEGLTPEEYIHRCAEDVKINTKLWEMMERDLLRLYGTQENVDRLVDYLSFKMDCAAEQERSGWLLDKDLCSKGLSELQLDLSSKRSELTKIMPPVPKKVLRNKPKAPYKINGELSAAGARWFFLLDNLGLPKDHSDGVKEVVGMVEPNPGSVTQVKDWLFSLGWSPQNFKHKRNPKTGDFRKIPQINSVAEDGLCTSIKALFDKEPGLKVLEGMSIISHRIGILNGFLGDVNEGGFVGAQIQGITNTLRFKHKIVLNLPGIDKPYGDLVRGCLIAPEGYELCGSDMSSLEDRTKQHFMWPHDPDYVKEMITPDFDPHLDIGVVAGMISKGDAGLYKLGDHKTKERLSSVRHDAKQINYSCTYGVTPQGLVRNNPTWTLAKSKKLHGVYWRRNWSLKEISNSCVTKVCMGRTWLYNPVSKLWYSLRSAKDKFSTLNQGTGVYCFDTWIKHIRSKRPQLTGQMHDEIILTIKEGSRDKCEKLLSWAISETNKELKLNRELGIDIQFGKNYSKIH